MLKPGSMVSGLSSCQNLASFFFFFFKDLPCLGRTGVLQLCHGHVWAVPRFLKFKKKKKNSWFAFGTDLGSVLPIPVSEMCRTRVLGQNRRVHTRSYLFYSRFWQALSSSFSFTKPKHVLIITVDDQAFKVLVSSNCNFFFLFLFLCKTEKP